MTDQEFTPIILNEIRKILKDENDYQYQRSRTDNEVRHLLFKLSMRLDQLQSNLYRRGVVTEKFQSLHLKNPYE